MGKTPEYTKRAIRNYNAKFDRVAVNLPKGTKEIIKEYVGQSCNAYMVELVLKDLEKRGVSWENIYPEENNLMPDTLQFDSFNKSNENRILQDDFAAIIPSLNDVLPTSTQAPPIETQAPPIETQEPPAATQEPPAATQEPPAATQEPSIPTQVSPVGTQSPSAATLESSKPTQVLPTQASVSPLLTRVSAQTSQRPSEPSQVPPVSIQVAQAQTASTATDSLNTPNRNENTQSIASGGKVPPSPLVKALLKNAAGPVQDIKSGSNGAALKEASAPTEDTQQSLIRTQQIQKDIRHESGGQTIGDMMSAREQQEDELSRLIEQKLLEEQERERQLGRRWPGLS